MKNIILIICLSLGIASCDSCKKPQPEPEIFLYCKIDGKDYWAKIVTDFGTPKVTANFFNNDSSIIISGQAGIQTISIAITDTNTNILVGNIYELSYPCCGNSVGIFDADFSVGWYSTNYYNRGTIQLESKDESAKILTGSFSFSAYDSTKNDSVHIKDGRFRMNFTRE